MIFVKLRQMPPQETQPLRVFTRDPALWASAGPGVERATLFEAPWERVEMLRLSRGHRDLRDTWPGGVEWFVVEGSIEVDGVAHATGAWLRFPPGATVQVRAPDHALLYRKSGHLARGARSPAA